jgi:hypothetical protein
MAVQKNFIIRNGLEVNNNLLVADSATDYVGIGTSSPKYTLEVIGGIGVTYANILGIATVGQEFNVGTGGTVITSLDSGLTGFGTATPAYIVDIRSPVSTGQTALYVQGDVRVTGDVYADDISLDQATFNNIEVSGVGTIRTASIDLGYVKTGIVTNLSTSGIGSITIAAIRDGYINTGIVTNLVTTGIASINTGVVTTAYVNTGIITTLSGSNLSYSGIGSFGSINADTGRINTGIVTNLVTTGIASVNTGVLTSAYVTTGIVTTISGTTLNYTGIGTVANFNATNATVSGLTTTGSLAVATGFDVYAADSTFHGSVTIDGNLSIGGTSAILNAVQVRVEDKDIILGFTTAITPSDDTANHGGVAIASTEGYPLVSFAVAGINTLPDTYKQVMWVKRNTMGSGTTDAFLFNYAVGVGSTQVPNGVRFAAGSIQFTENVINTPNLNVTGVSTIATASVDLGYVKTGIITTLSGSNLSYSGIVTAGSVTINGTSVISSGRQLQNIASLDATTTATIEAAIANAPYTSQDIVVTGIASINTGVFTSFFSPTGIITTLSGSNINYSGIGTFGTVSVDLGYVKTGIVTNLTTSGIGTITTAVIETGNIVTGVVTTITGTTLNYSGISTVGNFRITPVGSGATVGNSGIVTYYGDGSQLSNIISGVGIQSAGTLVGTGFTTLNFIGAGNTFAVNGTTIDISISGGGAVAGSVSGTQLISTVATGTAPLTVSSTTVVTNLNADLLDGINSASFYRSDASNTASGGVFRFRSADSVDVTNTGEINGLQVFQNNASTDALMSFHVAGDFACHFGLSGGLNDLVVGGWAFGANEYRVWHAGNDGAGSGLDADLLDGENLVDNAATGNTVVGRDASGNVIVNDLNSTSDIRLKTNIKTLTNSLNKVLQMRGVEFDRIDIKGKHQIGVIAQEIEEIVPELVTEYDNIKSVSYGNITALLIEAIKEQQDQINNLKKEVEELKK